MYPFSTVPDTLTATRDPDSRKETLETPISKVEDAARSAIRGTSASTDGSGSLKDCTSI